MSVIGRLWRRAPVWRVCLISAVAFTGLAAMFPPALPHLPPLRWPGTGGSAKPGATAIQAHFHPQPLPVASEQGILHLPPADGPAQQGLIHYAGRLLPLPAGSWQELAMARGGGTELQQITLLDRVVDNHLTGLVLVAAPGAMSGATGSIGVPIPCADPGRLVGHITPATDAQSPLTHECWAVTPVDMQDTAAHPKDDLLQRGLQRLGELHIAVPDKMLATTFYQSDDSGWQVATILVPDHGGPIRKLQDWATKFADVIHKGYYRTLVTADLTPAVTRDPA